MKNLVAKLCITGLLVVLSPMTVVAANESKGVDQYKFRVGNWRFDTTSHHRDGSVTKGMATSKNELIMGGRAISAHFENSAENNRGITVFVYNPAEDNWKLSYSSSDGGKAEVITFAAKMEKGKMVERWVKETPSGGYIGKGVYSDISDKGFTYSIFYSFDEGKRWYPVWVAKASPLG